MTSSGRRLWRRAKRGIADEVHARFEPDRDAFAERLSALEKAVADVLDALSGEVGSLKCDVTALREALAAQLDMENESSELIGRLLVRLAARVEDLEGLGSSVR
jgi:hypothetical protein